MQSKMKIHALASAQAVLLMALLAAMQTASAQAPSRFVGTITTIAGTTLTVKTDADGERQVEVPSAIPIKRVAPGQKDLSTAENIQFSELAAGDRVLVKLDTAATGAMPRALQIIVIKLTDIELKQQKEREDWQRRGVGGLVKSVDAESGVIVVNSGFGSTAKTVTVHTTNATILKRYAPASVQFDAAQPAPIGSIHAGDQLRARGAKNAEGTEIQAEEVISGSFRNISGVINSLDTATSTMVVKDLASKKAVTIHVPPATHMRRLPEPMARMLAARLKGTPGGMAGRPPSQNGAPAGMQHGMGQGNGQGGGASGDTQQMLNRLPAIQLADLKKGEAVMLVSTDGETDVTAITLLAGVEPLLEAPAASQNLLNNWSMGSDSADAAAQ